MFLTHEAAEFIFKIFLYCSCLAFAVYIPRMIYYIEGFKKPVRLSNPKKNNLAVLVPARNEAGLRLLLDSLAAQSYGSDFFDTYVIVADKNDSACSLYKKYRNTFCCCVENQTGKCDALDGALKFIARSGKKYGGYIVVDGDNVVDKDFVLEMNNALVSGRDIILGKRCVKNYLFDRKSRNWVVNCNGMIYTFLDKLGNCFRSKYAMHASICGTGIMLTDRLVEELGGWPFRSITEDFELAVSSLTEGRTVLYYEPAVTYTEESLSHKSANKRRRRWLLGYAQVSVKYRKKVSQKYRQDKAQLRSAGLSKEEKFFVRGNLWGCFDFLYSFFPLAIFFAPAAVCGLLLFVSAVATWIHAKAFIPAAAFLFGKAGIIFLSIYGVLFVYTLLGIFAAGNDLKISFAEKLVVLLVNPFFISEYAFFFLEAFYKIARGTEKSEWGQVERLDGQKEAVIK